MTQSKHRSQNISRVPIPTGCCKENEGMLACQSVPGETINLEFRESEFSKMGIKLAYPLHFRRTSSFLQQAIKNKQTNTTALLSGERHFCLDSMAVHYINAFEKIVWNKGSQYLSSQYTQELRFKIRHKAADGLESHFLGERRKPY